MARAWFGRGSEDFFVAGPLAPGDPYRTPPSAIEVTFWDAETGGTQYTDLLLDGTTPVTSISVPATGQPPAFQGPDGVVAMWAQAGTSTGRRMMDAGADIATQVAADRDQVAADRAAVEAVGTTNDTIIAGRINDPASATAAALTASIDGAVAYAYAGQLAVSEATLATRSGDDEIATPTPDGRTTATLLTGGTDQTWVAGSCTIADDTTRYKNGTQSKRITAAAAVTLTATIDPVYPAPAADPFTFAPASRVLAWVWIDDPTKITTLNFEVYDNAGLTNPWIRGKIDVAPPLRPGWNLLVWDAVGGALTNWGTAYRVRIVAVTTAATSFNVGKFWVECPPTAQLLFVADRGYKSLVTNGLADLRSRNIPVTWALDMALNGTSVGTDGEVISDADVATYYAAGDDVSMHAYDGAVTSTMTAAQIRADHLKCAKWLQDRGYTRGRQWRAAWTQNLADETAAVRPYAAAYASPSKVAALTAWPPANKWNVPRLPLHGLTSPDVDTAFANLQKTHGLGVFYTHGIHIHGTTGGWADTTPAQWTYFLGKIDAGIAGGWLEGVTFSQLLARSGGVLRA